MNVITHSSGPVGGVFSSALHDEKSRNSTFCGEIKKSSLVALKWAQGKHIRWKGCGRNWQGVKEQRQCSDGETFSTHWQILDICTLALKKTIYQTQTPALLGFLFCSSSRGKTYSFPHAGPLCVSTVVCNCDCVFVWSFISASLGENTTHVYTKQRLCGNTHLETKTWFQTGAKCSSPQIFMWLCHKIAVSSCSFGIPTSASVHEKCLFPSGRLFIPPC